MKRGTKTRAMALLMAAVMALGVLTGCAEETTSSEDSSALESSSLEEQVTLENDGTENTLVVAELSYSEERTETLKEIAQKYMADYPDTHIEIRTVDTREEMTQLLESGEQVDLCEVSWLDQPTYVEKGWLLDLSDYLEVWDEASTLTTAARQILRSMGSGKAYMIPATLNQDVLYYRSDWFDSYNQDKEADDMVYCRLWSDMLNGVGKLWGQGEGLVFGGQERLLDVFDSVLWSAMGLSLVSDQSVAYLSNAKDHRTIFTLDAALTALEQFQQVMTTVVPEESLSWTEDQAVDAFIDGKASMLLAGQDQMDKIYSAMEEGTVQMAPYPRGLYGIGVTSTQYTGFSVAAASEHEGNAVHFLTYLSDEDNNTHMAKVCQIPPIHTSAAEMEPSLEEGNLSVYLLMADKTDLYAYAQEPVMYSAWEDFRTEGDQALRDFLQGDLSGEKLLDQFDDYWGSAAAREGKLWE